MARRKGSPNRGSWPYNGEMKTVIIKLRVSQEWIETINAVRKSNCRLVKGSRSQIIRKMTMKGLLGSIAYDETIVELIKEQLERV